MKKSFITLLYLCFLPMLTYAQDQQDFMRSIGKIYVVVAVILAIFAGIVLFLIYLDRKISRLEKQIDKNG